MTFFSKKGFICKSVICGRVALFFYFYFSSDYNNDNNINKIIKIFERELKKKIYLEMEYNFENKAKVKKYYVNIDKNTVLKIDFIEDIFFKKPVIIKKNDIPIYSIEQIYFQKVMAVTGTNMIYDEIGREKITGRNEEKDVYDIYCLSKNIIPLNKFLLKMPAAQQRGMVFWYRSFSRQDFKLNILDLDIYNKEFEVNDLFKHFDNEIEIFLQGVIE